MLAPVLRSLMSAESFPLDSLTMLRLVLPGINNALTKSGDYFIVLFQFLRRKNWSFIFIDFSTNLVMDFGEHLHQQLMLSRIGLTVHQCSPSRWLQFLFSLWGKVHRNYLVHFGNRLYPQSKPTSFQIFFYHFQNGVFHVFANCRPIAD